MKPEEFDIESFVSHLDAYKDAAFKKAAPYLIRDIKLILDRHFGDLATKSVSDAIKNEFWESFSKYFVFGKFE